MDNFCACFILQIVWGQQHKDNKSSKRHENFVFSSMMWEKIFSYYLPKINLGNQSKSNNELCNCILDYLKRGKNSVVNFTISSRIFIWFQCSSLSFFRIKNLGIVYFCKKCLVQVCLQAMKPFKIKIRVLYQH